MQGAHQWNGNPDAITLAEISSRLPACRATRELLAEADALDFAATEPQAGLDHWGSQLDAALKEITSSSNHSHSDEPHHWGEIPNPA